MEEIKLIKNKVELQGTCYFEFLPGPYNGACWNETSVFIDEDVYAYLELVFARHIPDYDHYEFMQVEKDKWVAILDELARIERILYEAKAKEEIDVRLSFHIGEMKWLSAADFFENKGELSALIAEFRSWIEAQLQHHQSISVLGM